jgi:hypothetical protein
MERAMRFNSKLLLLRFLIIVAIDFFINIWSFILFKNYHIFYYDLFH